MIFDNVKDLSEEEFAERFATEEQCLEFLAYQKWKGQYKCKKCGNTNYCTGKKPFSRRCTRCKHDESAKVGTIFEGCRFSLPKAFFIAFCVCSAKKESSHELARKLELRQMTCWKFKKKLSICIAERTDLDQNEKTAIDEILFPDYTYPGNRE